MLSSPKTLLHKGVRLTLPEWAARKGIKYATLVARLSRGWSVASALDTPASQDYLPMAHSLTMCSFRLGSDTIEQLVAISMDIEEQTGVPISQANTMRRLIAEEFERRVAENTKRR